MRAVVPIHPFPARRGYDDAPRIELQSSPTARRLKMNYHANVPLLRVEKERIPEKKNSPISAGPKPGSNGRRSNHTDGQRPFSLGRPLRLYNQPCVWGSSFVGAWCTRRFFVGMKGVPTKNLLSEQHNRTQARVERTEVGW